MNYEEEDLEDDVLDEFYGDDNSYCRNLNCLEEDRDKIEVIDTFTNSIKYRCKTCNNTYEVPYGEY